jgi:hypothetical protein
MRHCNLLKLLCGPNSDRKNCLNGGRRTVGSGWGIVVDGAMRNAARGIGTQTHVHHRQRGEEDNRKAEVYTSVVTRGDEYEP